MTATPDTTLGVAVGTVGELWRYPVKSMLGERLDTAVVGPHGFLGDRAYAVVDADDGTVASAKVPAKWGALLGFRAAFCGEPEPGAPLPPADVRFPDGSLLRTDDERIHSALSSALGREVRLSADPVAGNAFEEVWPDIEGLAPPELIAGTAVGREETGEVRSQFATGLLIEDAPPNFFDLATLHLLTTATLAALTDRAPGATFDARRYRPNVLVTVPDADFTEDAWAGRAITAGEVGMAVSIPTMRCVMTTLGQEELPDDPDTLRAIAKHHRVDIPQMGRFACAGVYGAVTAPGRVAVGDAVTLG